MRTATTIGQKHGATEWTLISGPDVQLHVQKQAFRGLIGKPTNEQFALVRMQESDGPERTLKFGKPAKPVAKAK